VLKPVKILNNSNVNVSIVINRNNLLIKCSSIILPKEVSIILNPCLEISKRINIRELLRNLLSR